MPPSIYQIRGMMARKRALQEEIRKIELKEETDLHCFIDRLQVFSFDSERVCLITYRQDIMGIPAITQMRDWLNELLEPHDEIGGGIGANMRTEGGS